MAYADVGRVERLRICHAVLHYVHGHSGDHFQANPLVHEVLDI